MTGVRMANKFMVWEPVKIETSKDDSDEDKYF